MSEEPRAAEPIGADPLGAEQLVDQSAPVLSADPPSTGRRRLTAHGAVINAGFSAFLGALQFLRALTVASLLTAAEFGVWTVILVTSALLIVVKMSTVNDKYIQQSEPDQVHAFQKAFTLDLGSGLLIGVLMVGAAPLLAAGYGRSELLAPALVMALMMPALGLRLPVSIFYRRMQFFRLRVLQAVDPLVALAVTLVLVTSGSGYWALVIGTVAGAWAAAVVALIACPFPLRLRFDWETTRHYVSFSTPLVLSATGAMLMAQSSVIVSEAALGLAGAGAIGLAATFRAYTARIEQLINGTIYPAVCRVVERTELLFEVAIKANRLSMMWGVPFGLAVALFAPDLVEFVLGDSWSEAVIVLQVFGAGAAIDQIGLNWTVFYRALGRTRPIAVATFAALIAFSITALPLMFVAGLDGYAIGLGFAAVVSLAFRAHYLLALFPQMKLGRHAVRALGPVAPAVGMVLLVRLVEAGERTLAIALAELAAYILVTAVITIVIERRLLREVWGYVRRRSAPADPGPAPAASTPVSTG